MYGKLTQTCSSHSKRKMDILILFNVLFFWSLYTKPFQLATSELLSTFFPTWLWQGKMWAQWRIPKYEPCFWLNAHVHPVLSTYYPGSILSSLLGSLTGLDTAFKILVYTILGHYLWASVGWYVLLAHYFEPTTATIGAILFTYQAYHIKQQPCIVYTLAWLPWIAIIPWLGISMMLLAGYYPLAMYLLPVGLLLTKDLVGVLAGFLIGLIQIIPFIRYLPKTIRSHSKLEPSVGPWERNFSIGVVPIVILTYTLKPVYLTILLPIVTSKLLARFLPRVTQRAWILSAYLAIYFCLVAIRQLNLNGLQLNMLLVLVCLDQWLWHRQLIPTRPYCELQAKPSLAFNNRLTQYLSKHLGSHRVSGLPFPLFTGIINGFRTLGYSGGMQLKLMAKWRNDNNPNGSGMHDYFRGGNNYDSLTRHNVKFSFTRKRLDWPSTGIKFLYRNPSDLLQG